MYYLTKFDDVIYSGFWVISKIADVNLCTLFMASWIIPLSLVIFNPLCANFTKWSNTHKHFVSKLPTNCLSVWPFYGIGTLRVNLENVEKKRKIQKTKYLKNEKSFLDEIKGFFIVFEGLSFGERNRKYKHKL